MYLYASLHSGGACTHARRCAKQQGRLAVGGGLGRKRENDPSHVVISGMLDSLLVQYSASGDLNL